MPGAAHAMALWCRKLHMLHISWPLALQQRLHVQLDRAQAPRAQRQPPPQEHVRRLLPQLCEPMKPVKRPGWLRGCCRAAVAWALLLLGCCCLGAAAGAPLLVPRMAAELRACAVPTPTPACRASKPRSRSRQDRHANKSLPSSGGAPRSPPGRIATCGACGSSPHLIAVVPAPPAPPRRFSHPFTP